MYYYQNDAFEEALNNLNKCISMGGNKSSFYAQRGIVYEALDDFFLAEKDYLKAIEIEPENYYNYYLISDFYKNTEDISKAIEAISKAIEINSNDDFLWNTRAGYYLDNGQVSEAEQDFSSAVELNTNADNLYFRAQFYLDLNKMSLAISDLEKALEIDPTEIDVLNLLGDVYLEIKDTVMAVKMYSIGVNIDSLPQFSTSDLKKSRTTSLLNRANIYENQGKNELADSDYLRAIKIDPENDQIYQDRSLFLQRIGENSKALINISKAIELNNNADNLFYRADIYIEVGENQLAINDLENALKITPTDIDVLSSLADIYVSQGDTISAIKTYQEGASVDVFENSFSYDKSSKSFCYLGLAEIYISQDGKDSAEFYLDQAIRFDSTLDFAYFSRGTYHKGNGDYVKALSDYSQAIKLYSNSSLYLQERSKVYFKMGEFQLAQKDLDEIIRLYPNPVTLSERGYFYGQIGDFQKAFKDFNVALNFDDENSRIYQRRCLTYIAQNEYEEAITDCYNSIKLDKNDPESYYYLGYIFALKGEYLKSVKYYNLAIDKIGGEKNYYIAEMQYRIITKSDVYISLAEIYLKLENKQLACEEFQNALEELNEEKFLENRGKKVEKITENLRDNCN